MHRLLLFIISLLISIVGFAQTAPSDSTQAARKAQIEKAREAARARARAKAEERAKMEAEKQKADKSTNDNVKQENVKQDKTSQKAESEKRSSKKEDVDKEKKTDKADSQKSEEKSKRDRKSRDEKKDKSVDASKTAAAKDAPKEKVKKPSIKERNMADTAVAKSKYGPGTYGWRGNVGASVAWSDYSDRKDKTGFDSWGFVLNGGMGYRFNHVLYTGILFDIEAIELLAFSPMLDLIVAAPTPIAPFVELTAGPYISYAEDRNWVFQPRFGLSYRGKKNKIMRFGFGLRMYDDAFKADSFKPQYAASVTAEF